MKNINLHKTAQNFMIVLISLFVTQKNYAQFVNTGDTKINGGTLISIYFDYKNTPSGNFINDGEVHVFENWENDGIVSYSSSENGKTVFKGTTEQIIEGAKQSDFQNIVFNNLSSAIPFHLATTIAIGKLADFKKGIINADDYGGLLIFKDLAFHTNVGNQSFVDGRAENNIDKPFEFPVGDALFFRPAFYSSNSPEESVYTSQYFYKNSAIIYPHTSKEESIIQISDTEYWSIIQNQGTEKIVLSLTLSPDTTPSIFFSSNPETELAIVRWDNAGAMWVNDGGVLSDPLTNEAYSHLLTNEVGGYGIFTMAVVKKSDLPTDDLTIYNAISPNGDGFNDKFHIKGIDKYPNNTVEIYNRWGIKVYQADSYNESENMFSGYSDGRSTFKKEDKLPSGTYFYTLKYNKNSTTIKKGGYLYINNE